MQEQTVTFDVASLPYEASTIDKLLIIYLLVVAVIAVIWCGHLLFSVFSVRRKIRVVPSSTELGGTDLLVRYALRNRLRVDIPVCNLSDDLSRKLGEADVLFQYLWQKLYNRALSLRNLTGVTFFVTLFVFGFDTFRLLNDLQSLERLVPFFVLRGFAELLIPFNAGLLACVILCGAWATCDRILLCRKAEWNYFVSKNCGQTLLSAAVQ